MKTRLGEWLGRARRAFGSRYVRILEDELARSRDEVTRERAEIDRLRLENRALLNSLLGTAGVPPVEESRTHQPVVRRGGPHFWRPQV